jgi:hypothetical protein
LRALHFTEHRTVNDILHVKLAVCLLYDSPSFVVCVCFVQGTQIQGTFWRESAEKYLDALQEGKVGWSQV